jgi:hypothetical protein
MEILVVLYNVAGATPVGELTLCEIRGEAYAGAPICIFFALHFVDDLKII